MYSFAHDFISDTSILEINPKKCFLETSDFLKYFYYAGIVHISVKDFKKALECFNEVLSFPADLLSAVCVEAYKKGILVALIQYGKVYNDIFPRYGVVGCDCLLCYVMICLFYGFTSLLTCPCFSPSLPHSYLYIIYIYAHLFLLSFTAMSRQL